jgi:hypothetical protein
MKKFQEINYGNKIVLLDCEVQTKSILQGEELNFQVEWKLLDRLPLGQKICYYFTNGTDSTFFTLDTEQPITHKMFYSQFLSGETFKDNISISIPYNLTPGNYEINAFLYPSEDFGSSDGINSKVWNFRGCRKVEVKWQYDLSEKFSNIRSRKNSFF